MENNELLVQFLTTSIEEIKNDTIDGETLRKLGEVYMGAELEKFNDEEEISKKDMIKFISLGWYVYYVLLKDKIKF